MALSESLLQESFIEFENCATQFSKYIENENKTSPEIVNFSECVKGPLKGDSEISWEGRPQFFDKARFLHVHIAYLQMNKYPKGIRQQSFRYETRTIFVLNCPDPDN